jgi:hypothetical protein
MDHPYCWDRPLGLLFADASQAYCNGFEAGLLWAQMQDDADQLTAIVHVGNVTTVLRLARSQGYYCLTEMTQHQGWIRCILTKMEKL